MMKKVFNFSTYITQETPKILSHKKGVTVRNFPIQCAKFIRNPMPEIV